MCVFENSIQDKKKVVLQISQKLPQLREVPRFFITTSFVGVNHV